MPDEADVLLLAEAIADWADVDWNSTDSNATGSTKQQVIAQLRVLDTLGRTARAQARAWGSLEIRAEIGRGTFGTVYRAWDPRLEREVALKLFNDQEASEAAIREGRLLAQIRHANVVAVLGADSFEGTVGVWMEFVVGRTLKEIVSSHGPLGAQEAAIIGRDLCRALAAVHHCGILHGDIKAQNVVREAGGRTVLMDFGAGHKMTGGYGGAVAGTPAYLAPEILEGGALTVRGDLYSLGVLLYFLVTGSFPVTGTSLKEIRQLHAARGSTPLRDARPELPHVFIRAVELATAADPSGRPASAGALEELLDASLRGDAPKAEILLERPSGYGGRHFPWYLIASVLLVSTMAIGWRFAHTGRTKDDIVAGVPRQITFAPGLEAQPALSPDGHLIAYSSTESGQAHIWISDVNGGNPVQVTTGRGRETRPAWFPDGSAIAYVVSQGGRESVWKTPPLGGSATLIVNEGTDPAISPDGRFIAFAAGRGFDRISVAPIDGASRARFVTSDDDGLFNHRSPSWSPDGQTIAYAAQNALWLVRVAGGRAIRLTTDAQADRDPVWSADGEHIYFSSNRQGTEALWRIHARGGSPERVTMGTGPERQPNISHDGRRLAYSTQSTGSDVVLLSVLTGREWRLPSVKDEVMPTFSPDQKTLAFASNRWDGRSDLWIQDLVGGGVPRGNPRRITEHGGANYPTFSPDGKWLAYGRVLGEQRDIWIIDASGGMPVRLTTGTQSHFHPSWSPDSSRVAYVAAAGNTSRIEYVQVANGRAIGTPVIVVTENDAPTSPVWSRDARTLAFVLRDEVWVVSADARSDPRQVTHGVTARRLHWTSKPGQVYVSGLWGRSRVTIKVLDVYSGKISELPREVVIGEGDNYIDFDVSRDEMFIAVPRENTRGDIWVIETTSTH
jgi:serine/threonine-protein kinase